MLWDLATGKSVSLIGHLGPVGSIAFSPDGNLLVSGSEDGTLIFWNVLTGQARGQPLSGHAGSVTRVAFSPDGRLLASASVDKTIILWDVLTGQPIDDPPLILAGEQRVHKPLLGHQDQVLSLAFSPDGQQLASGGADEAIILWNMVTTQKG